MARGTTQEIIGDRKVAEVRCDDCNHAFALLDTSNLPVQVHGKTLRVSGDTETAAQRLSQAGINATIETVPANLEEAFVALVTKPAA